MPPLLLKSCAESALTGPMTTPSNPIILIPARMASTRLPGKPLADINGLAMIVQVMKRAEEAGLGPSLVAAAEPEIVSVVTAAGGRAVLTDPDHPSGSDRIFEALQREDPNGIYDAVINVQGDLPTLDPALITEAFETLQATGCDIATLVTEITDPAERDNPNVVKAIAGFKPGETRAQALYFTRATAPTGDGPLYHHIGLYAYRRDALARFVALPPGILESREKLEQLRALENGMTIQAALVDTVPLGVDTPEDLEKARRALSD